MPLAVTLDDKYILERGRVYLTGTQALVRLPMMQRQRDVAAGLNTGGYISGYRGSPLGGFDQALWQAKKFIKKSHIEFQPGTNEDLAATALWGTQQIHLYPGARYDGVFGMWYGKGPGVDRSGDVFKHANYAGTSKHGGIVALAGDDHMAKSSTVAHQSEPAFMSAGMPVIHPAGVQEYLDWGLHAFAMSRYSGLWVAFKVLSETVDSSASVYIDPHRVEIHTPTDFVLPPDGVHIRWPDDWLGQERRVVTVKQPAALAYWRANKLDRLMLGRPDARFGIVTVGKSYLDVRQALDELGIADEEAERLGLAIYKVGMVWPLETEGATAFAAGKREILVIEEKRNLIEQQLKDALFNAPADRRPVVVGKTDERGQMLLKTDGELTPYEIASAIVARFGLDSFSSRTKERFEALKRRAGRQVRNEAGLARVPYFCSGCPHNSSTKVPDGSMAMAGIGCHTLAIGMERNTKTFTHMGAEGAPWVGASHFTDMPHVFQNLGDGTYFHSGYLAIRHAVATNTTITYKILYNDAVAMTGGQPHDGNVHPWTISQQVHAEGVGRIALVSDEPDKYPVGTPWAPGVTFHHRDQLDEVQRELREVKGVSVLIYDQTCAAEKRRRRKRGTFPDPNKRLFINEAVCEGCGDCSVKSNCLSVVPVETEFGRKRAIDQSSCNKDTSCIEGFCPSFVIVEGGEMRKKSSVLDRSRFASLPEVAPAAMAECNVLTTGVGGTGVVTIGSVLAMAANLVGMGANSYNMTGLAQKGGAVFSHLRIAASPAALKGSLVGPAEADLVLGCDMVTAASPDGIKTCAPGRTRVLLNGNIEPTAAFQANRDYSIDTATLAGKLRERSQETITIDAGEAAERLLGDKIGANMLLVGYAYQKGWLPLPLAALRRAVELNGAAVQFNLDAFDLGRLAAIEPEVLLPAKPPEAAIPDSLEGILAHRVAHLTRYQNVAWAQRYAGWVEKARNAEQAVKPGSQTFALAVARNLAKLMAYKDEYEVARLYGETPWRRDVSEAMQGDVKLSLYLAPPLLSRPDPETGRPRKIKFGAWIFPAMRLLAGFKWLRGSALDPFGRTDERRGERQLIAEYETDLALVIGQLSGRNLQAAIAWAEIPDAIRGYGPVKEAAMAAAKPLRQAALNQFHRSGAN